MMAASIRRVAAPGTQAEQSRIAKREDASGEDATQTLPDIAWHEPKGPFVGGALNPYAEKRIPNSRHATIYALDGQTGRELWSSGNTITSFNHWSGMTVANGRVYLGMFDGTLYSFGVTP